MDSYQGVFSEVGGGEGMIFNEKETALEYLKKMGYFDRTDKEIKTLFRSIIKEKDIDWNIFSYRFLKGMEFQVRYYELRKYTAYLESFIRYLKNRNKKKGYKELPKHFYNSYDWAEVRILILNRDNFKCKHCGDLANHIDHVNSAIYFPEMALDPTNLISTCKSCHDKRHGRCENNDRD